MLELSNLASHRTSEQPWNIPNNLSDQRQRRSVPRPQAHARHAERPRLSVFRSHKHIYGQIIDDLAGKTLAAASSHDKRLRGQTASTAAIKTAAQAVGKAIAERAMAAGIKAVCFDRGPYQVSRPRGRPGRRGPRRRIEVLIDDIHLAQVLTTRMNSHNQANPRRGSHDTQRIAFKANLIDKIVKIKRCAAVVKGGRRFSFAAMVVVGDGKGKVGWGYGKANEVPPSVEKAVKEGMRSMVDVSARRRHDSARGRRPLRRRPRDPGAGRARHRRDRRHGGAGRVRSGRHPRHPHQELRLEQSRIAGQGDVRGA